jgi:hypothetical protein
MKSSDLAGSFSWQSASLPGSEVISSAVLRRVSSRALRAASRAAAASTIFHDVLAGTGFSSNHWLSFSVIRLSTMGRTSEETSLSLVCAGEFGIGHFHREDAGEAFAGVVAGDLNLFFFRDAGFLRVFVDATRVSAPRKPARCVPPSRCGMLLVKQRTFS